MSFSNLAQYRNKILFALLGSGLMVWQLIQPGYLLLLDWVPGPISLFPYNDLSNFLHAPSNLLIYILSSFIPVWIVQKMLLISICFSLFFVPLCFFPWTKYPFAPYFASLLAAINPFVYERLLAGQWRVLVGYICLFPLLYYLLKFTREASQRSALGVFATLLFTGFWSIHFFAIGIVISGIYLGVHFIAEFRLRATNSFYLKLKQVCIASLIFLTCSLYWIVPLALLGSSELKDFNDQHFSAFTTVRDEQIGVVLHVLTLRGFWATGEGWGEQYKLPGDNAPLFYLGLIALLVCIGIGWRALKSTCTFFERRILIIIAVCATVFATGVSAYGLWQINFWLLENAPFWNGFRDAQKWAGVLATIYSLLFGIGISVLVAKAPRFKYLIGIFAVAIVLSLSPYQLFGLYGQVAPVWYPTSWSEVDAILKQEENCTAVFLPWHQYYAVSWNNGQLVGNPAKQAFSCEIFAGENTELGAITTSRNRPERETKVETAVISNRSDEASLEQSIALLKEAGVTYIIYASDLAGRDIYLYPLLSSPALTILYQSPEITLYKIN